MTAIQQATVPSRSAPDDVLASLYVDVWRKGVLHALSCSPKGVEIAADSEVRASIEAYGDGGVAPTQAKFLTFVFVAAWADARMELMRSALATGGGES